MYWLVDGNSLGRIVFHALPLTAKEGDFVHALGLWTKVFLQKLVKWADKHPPAHVFICWDTPSAIRRQRLAVYKKNRKTLAHRVAFNEIAQAFQTLVTEAGLPSFNVKVDGLEADDLIAVLVHALQGQPTLLISADKDFYQLLIGEHVKFLKTFPASGKEELVTRKSFEKAYGFDPRYYWVYLATVGDSADGIKGVRRYGPKAFSKDLASIGIEGIIDSFQDSQDFQTARYLVQLPNYHLIEQVLPNYRQWANQTLSLPQPSCSALNALAQSLLIRTLSSFGRLCV